MISDILLAMLVIALVGGLCYIVYVAVEEAKVTRQCLAAGYADASWFLIGDSYCHRIENARTITVPVSEVLRAE